MANLILQKLSNQAVLESLLELMLLHESTDTTAPLRLYGLIDASQSIVMDNLLNELMPYRIDQSELLNLYDDIEGPEIAAIGMRLISLQTTKEAIAAACHAAFNSMSMSLIVSTSETTLAAHLRQLREVVLPDGMRALFRYQDTRVATALMPLLKPEQARSLLGEATAWFAPHVCGQAYGWQYTQTPSKYKAHQLKLTDKQMLALDDALFVNTVEQQTKETDSSLLDGMSACAITTLLNQRIAQGVEIGLKGRSDLSLYTVLSLQLPPGFETKQPFAQAIERAVKGHSGFAAALDEVSSEQWQVFELEKY